MSGPTQPSGLMPPSPMAWPDDARGALSLSFDVDAESPILFQDPAAAARMSVMSHQAYGPLVGVPRLLGMLDRLQVPATFFVPGYTAHRWPQVVRDIVSAGHEVAHHGYLHETLAGFTEQQEVAVLDRGLAALEEVAGVRPVGFRGPMGEINYWTPRLLAERGFLYDSSLMDSDWPYELATPSGSIVEIPWHWAQDDWEQYCYLPGLTGSGLIESPDKTERMWRTEIRALVEESGCYTLIAHPFLTGRPARAAVVERLVRQAQEDGDIWVAGMAQVAEHIRSLRLPPRVHDQPLI